MANVFEPEFEESQRATRVQLAAGARSVAQAGAERLGASLFELYRRARRPSPCTTTSATRRC